MIFTILDSSFQSNCNKIGFDSQPHAFQKTMDKGQVALQLNTEFGRIAMELNFWFRE